MEWENLSGIKMIMLYRKNKNGQLIWDANILAFIQCFTWHQQQKQLISLPVPLNRDLRRKSQKYWKKQWLSIVLLGRNLWPQNQSALTFTALNQHGLVKDMYTSPQSRVWSVLVEQNSVHLVCTDNFVTKPGQKNSILSQSLLWSDLHFGLALAGSWGRTIVDNRLLAPIPMWIKLCRAGGNCLPNSQGHKSRSSCQHTQGKNPSLHAEHHQHWHSAERGKIPGQGKTNPVTLLISRTTLAHRKLQ